MPAESHHTEWPIRIYSSWFLLKSDMYLDSAPLADSAALPGFIVRSAWAWRHILSSTKMGYRFLTKRRIGEKFRYRRKERIFWMGGKPRWSLETLISRNRKASCVQFAMTNHFKFRPICKSTYTQSLSLPVRFVCVGIITVNLV